MQQITTWKSPCLKLDTEYGNITYRQWCFKECSRMGQKYIIKDNLKREAIAIFKKDK